MTYNYAHGILRVTCTNTVQRGIERKAQIMSAYLVGCMDKRLAKGHHNAIRGLGLTNDCYMHLRAAGAASIGVIAAIRREAKLVNAHTIILTIHTDCQGCKDVARRLRNLKANAALARRLFPKKQVITLNIGIDGSYYRI